MEDWPELVNTFCQIFRGFPLKCVVGPDRKKQFCSSPTSQLWSVILVSVQFLASVLWTYNWYEMYNMNSKLFYHDHNLFRIYVLVRGIAITTMVLVLFFSYNRKQMRFVHIHDFLDTFDKNLKLTTKRANATMKVVVTCFVVTAVLSISSLLRIIYSLKANLSFQEQRCNIIHIFCMVSMACAQSVFFIHFSHITQSIAARFVKVTYKIEQVVVRNNFRSLMPYQVQVSDCSCGGYTATGRIKALIRDYWLLCDTVREANSFYSDQLLVVVLTTFLRTVNCLPAFVIHYTQGNMTGIINAGIWALTHISFLLLIAYLSTNVTESADEMTRTVCRLINMEIDDELREQLEEFLLQLSNQKLVLSACGFFNINYETVISMAGAITTYMVILIQLQKSP